MGFIMQENHTLNVLIENNGSSKNAVKVSAFGSSLSEKNGGGYNE
jgi:hypothetical protein